MKRQLLVSLALMSSLVFPLSLKAEPTKGYNTYDAMGCMLLQECTDGVVEVKNHKDVAKHFKKFRMTPPMSDEFDQLVNALNKVGSKVFIAPDKYFPPGHRGVYHTVSNNFYLNEDHVWRYNVLMTVMRHEGWHAAQDCMAGSIKNSMIAIIMPEEKVPPLWREMVERTYPASAVPWEAEATWAGKTEGMTQKALESCARGTMWTDYEPTPMTKEWLKENGFIK
jgi:hypothetical protein